MTPQRRGRRWTAKSWTGSRSGWTSRSRRGRTPRHRVATWADPPETLTDSAGAAAEVAVTSAEAGEVTEIPDLATRTEETDTEMSGDMTTTGREIAIPPTTTGGEMTGIMREAAEEAPVEEDTPRREGTLRRIGGGMTRTPLLPPTASVPGGHQVPTKETPDQGGSTGPGPGSTREDTNWAMTNIGKLKIHVTQIMSYVNDHMSFGI